MAAVTKEIVIDVPVERFYDLVVDYERYPEFVPAVKTCRPRREGGAVDVYYEVDLGLKTLRYTLRHVEERPRRVTWSLVSGEMMKISNGSWDLSDAGGRTRALYTVEIQVTRPPLVPQALVDRVSDELTKVQLPRTLDAFKHRAERG